MDHPPPRPDAAERAERHLAAVAELADCALQLARDAARKALAHSAAEAEAQAAGLPPPTLPRQTGPDPADAFCRMSREVCRLILLEMRLAGARPGRDDRDRDDRVRGRDQGARRLGKAQVRRILREAVVADPGEPDREHAVRRVDEAMASDRMAEVIAGGDPLGDVVETICRCYDLWVDPDRLPDEALETSGRFPILRHAPRPAPAPAEQGPDPP